MKYKRDKTMRQNLTKLWHEQTWHERLSEDFTMTDGNLETIYCGEVIGDEVQMWNRKQGKWQGKKHDKKLTWKHNKEPENKNNQKIERDKYLTSWNKWIVNMNIHPSIFCTRSIRWSGRGGTGAYRSGHRARGGVQPGPVASPSQGHTETNKHTHAHTHS